MNDVIVVVTTAFLSFTATNAFQPSLFHVSSTRSSTADFQPLHMSSIDDDELSRLIGKRSQIKRKKREELPNEDDFLDSLGSDPSSLDLEKMPEFQTKRKARVPKKPKEEESGKQKTEEPEFNDYYEDYVSIPILR